MTNYAVEQTRRFVSDCDKLRDLEIIDSQLTELRKISRNLHQLNEDRCNYEISQRQETREANLEKRAAEIASGLGFGIYFQGDPRGCAIYLIPKDWDTIQADSNYPSGMAIY